MNQATDIIVETGDPDGLDKILQTFGAVVVQSDIDVPVYMPDDGLTDHITSWNTREVNPVETRQEAQSTATPALHRYDYVEVGGKRERTRVDKVYVWAAVHTPTGEVELDDVREFDDQLKDLVEGFEWRKFRMIPYEDK